MMSDRTNEILMTDFFLLLIASTFIYDDEEVGWKKAELIIISHEVLYSAFYKNKLLVCGIFITPVFLWYITYI